MKNRIANVIWQVVCVARFSAFMKAKNFRSTFHHLLQIMGMSSPDLKLLTSYKIAVQKNLKKMLSPARFSTYND